MRVERELWERAKEEAEGVEGRRQFYETRNLDPVCRSMHD